MRLGMPDEAGRGWYPFDFGPVWNGYLGLGPVTTRLEVGPRLSPRKDRLTSAGGRTMTSGLGPDASAISAAGDMAEGAGALASPPAAPKVRPLNNKGDHFPGPPRKKY